MTRDYQKEKKIAHYEKPKELKTTFEHLTGKVAKLEQLVKGNLGKRKAPGGFTKVVKKTRGEKDPQQIKEKLIPIVPTI